MIGTSASAGCRPIQKNPTHETLPAASRYGQKLRRRAHPSPRSQADPEKPDPREAACGEQIWPEAADARPPQSGSDADRSRQDERATREVNLSRLIEHCDAQEPEGVGGDSEKKQERNYRVRPEDESRDEIADSEIRRQGDRPA